MSIPASLAIQAALASEKAHTEITDAMVSALESAGVAGVSAIHRYIDAGIPPSNSPVIVSGG